MSDRKPPRLTNWLLNRFGVARQNPPLAGDLLEEFRTGRSAAWFWRQTLVAILTGLVRSVRESWWFLTGAAIGWTAQASIAFALWRLHLPPQLPLIVRTAVLVLMYVHLAWRLWRGRFRRKSLADDGPAVAEPVEVEEVPDFSDLVAAFCGSFTAFLVGYCALALFWVFPLWGFILLQSVWLLIAVAFILMPGHPDPGEVKIP
jgi:hypothetical protein